MRTCGVAEDRAHQANSPFNYGLYWMILEWLGDMANFYKMKILII